MVPPLVFALRNCIRLCSRTCQANIQIQTHAFTHTLSNRRILNNRYIIQRILAGKSFSVSTQSDNNPIDKVDDDTWEWIPPKNRVRPSERSAEEEESKAKINHPNYYEVEEAKGLLKNESENTEVTIEDVIADLKAQGVIALDYEQKDFSYQESELELELDESDYEYMEMDISEDFSFEEENVNFAENRELISSETDLNSVLESEQLPLQSANDAIDGDDFIVPIIKGKRLTIDEILKILEVNSALDVVAYDLAEKSMMADFIVLASAKSRRHVRKLEREIKYYTKKRQVRLVPSIPPRRGTFASDDWIAIDTGTIIVNVFLEEVRADMALDEHWQDVAQKYERPL
mmetsp:Transcript_11543/g.15045  ORF Transcript_11543/g.15045 Transcript_11543/m.15045 type:complete len:346 (-) Transcript_11543:252-1289(-)